MREDDFVYAIPSYNRVDRQTTVNYLNRIGIPRERIYIFVQTENDEKLYKKTVGEKANVIYQYAERGVEARNNILSALVHDFNVLMLDDDVRAVGELANGKIVKIEGAQRMNGLFSTCFNLCRRRGAAFFGIYPVYNAFFMEKSVSTKAPINTVFGFPKGFNGEYDEAYDTKEDAALCAKVLSDGQEILRFNGLAVDADHRKNKNGYIDPWHQEENIRCVQKLLKEFPNVYKSQTNKPWEVRSIVKDKKIEVQFLWT